MTLGTLVERAKPSFGSFQAIADAAGISLSALLRAMKEQQVLGTDKLIALAETIGESPDVVLRAAGKGETADALERLYGKPKAPLSAMDRALVGLPARKKKGLLAVAR